MPDDRCSPFYRPAGQAAHCILYQLAGERQAQARLRLLVLQPRCATVCDVEQCRPDAMRWHFRKGGMVVLVASPVLGRKGFVGMLVAGMKMSFSPDEPGPGRGLTL